MYFPSLVSLPSLPFPSLPSLPSFPLAEKRRVVMEVGNRKLHGGGHINHSPFWRSLSPAPSPAAAPAAAPTLVAAIKSQCGLLDAFRSELKALLLAIQGSGWGWAVKRGDHVELATTGATRPPTAMPSGTPPRPAGPAPRPATPSCSHCAI